MLDPKTVRKRRQEAIQQCQIQDQTEFMEEANKIFQWILKLIDEKNKQGFFGAITVWQFDDSNEICAGSKNYINSYSRDKIFPVVCEIINAEEGYHAEYRTNVVMYDDTGWDLTVTVE